MNGGSTQVLVIDASVAVKWHLSGEEDADKAELLLRRHAQEQVQLIAPTHLRYEVASAITVATRGRQPRLTQQQGQDAIADFLRLDLPTVDTAELIAAAYTLVHRHGGSFYDSLYLALAQDIRAVLVTADNGFYRIVGHLPEAIRLSDYDPA